jgi:hypothetical protein
VLYDIIGRQRLEARVIVAIHELVKRCPPELYGYLNLPIVRRTRGSQRPLHVVLRTTESGWFVTADGFYTKYDSRWLAKLDISELRTCLRFLTQGKDIALEHRCRGAARDRTQATARHHPRVGVRAAVSKARGLGSFDEDLN